jgi:hypothetical protein
MHRLSPRVLMPLLAAANLSCLADSPDAVHQCDVGSPNDSWKRGNVSMAVTSPVCPVTIHSSTGEVQTYTANVAAPIDMPSATYFYTDIYNVQTVLVKGLQNWWYNEAGLAKSLVSGNYVAGSGGFPIGAVKIQDVGRAYFAVTAAYGVGPADGRAMLPYRWPTQFSSSAPSQKLTASQWETPKVGNTSFLRVVPQFDESLMQVSFKWYFDGKRIVDTAKSFDPRTPVYWNARTYTAKVWTRGTHTWKVDMEWGSYPNIGTKTITWSQTWY